MSFSNKNPQFELADKSTRESFIFIDTTATEF